MSNNVENTLSKLIKIGINAYTQDNPYENLTNDLTNLINNNMSNYNAWQPPYDIVETENEMLIYIEIPGVDEKSLELEFLNNKLTIYGEKSKLYEGLCTQGEILYGKFGRVITLPLSITNQDNIVTKIEKGILEIKIKNLREEMNKFSIKFQ